MKLCRELERGEIRVLDSFSFSRFLGAKGRRSLTSSGRNSPGPLPRNSELGRIVKVVSTVFLTVLRPGKSFAIREKERDFVYFSFFFLIREEMSALMFI